MSRRCLAPVLVVLAVVALGVVGWLHRIAPRGLGDLPGGPANGVPVHPLPWALAVSADGETLYVACGPVGSIAEIDVARRTVRARIPVDAPPRGLALSPDGDTLAVSLEGKDEVVLFDVSSREETARFAVGGDPEGLAFSADGRRLFVANRLSRDVSVVDLEAAAECLRIPAGQEPFALVRSPDGATMAVVSRRATIAPPDEMPSSEVTILDAATLEVRARTWLPSCHLSEAGAFTPDSRFLLVPAVRVRNLLPIVQVARGWALSGMLAVVDVETGDVALMPLQFANEGFADPTGVAIAPDGSHAYVASGGADEIAVIDLPAMLARRAEGRPDLPERFSITREYVLRRAPVGDNPRGLTWLGRGADGEVAVANRLDDDVMFLDLEGRILARIPVGPPLPEDAIHRGRRAFFDASYCFQDAFSCTSCHPEGHTDGLTYDFEIDGVGRNALLNRSLQGLEGTAPYKWTGINPSLQRQCGARFAMVLTRAETIPPDVLDDMAAFLLLLPPPRALVDASRAEGALAERIARGRVIFERSRRKDGTRLRASERCITCHPPPLYTNNQTMDVGTRGPGDDDAAFDTPHLTGTGGKVPYLHDGRATTLEAIFTTSGAGDRHGYVSDLTAEEIRDLVAFLEGL